MPTSSTGSNKLYQRDSAFTLIELLTVMAIILAVGMALLPSAVGFIAAREVYGAAKVLNSLTRYARESAVDLQTQTTLAYDSATGVVRVEWADVVDEDGDSSATTSSSTNNTGSIVQPLSTSSSSSQVSSDGSGAVKVRMMRELSSNLTLSYEAATEAETQSSVVNTSVSSSQVASTTAQTEEWSVTFSPDGTCTGGEVLVEGRRGRSCSVHIDKLLGKASVVDTAEEEKDGR